MDDVFNIGREQEDDMYKIIADDDGSRYLNDSGEEMLEGSGDEGNDLELTTKSAEVYIYI